MSWNAHSIYVFIHNRTQPHDGRLEADPCASNILALLAGLALMDFNDLYGCQMLRQGCPFGSPAPQIAAGSRSAHPSSAIGHHVSAAHELCSDAPWTASGRPRMLGLRSQGRSLLLWCQVDQLVLGHEMVLEDCMARTMHTDLLPTIRGRCSMLSPASNT